MSLDELLNGDFEEEIEEENESANNNTNKDNCTASKMVEENNSTHLTGR
jgi:hypothetical protein